MRRQNVDFAQRVYDAFVRRDLDGFFALADADVEIIPRHSALEGVSYRGHDGVRRWWEKLFGVFPDFRAEVEEVRNAGDSVSPQYIFEARNQQRCAVRGDCLGAHRVARREVRFVANVRKRGRGS